MYIYVFIVTLARHFRSIQYIWMINTKNRFLFFGTKSCAMFWIEWKINFTILAIFSFRDIVVKNSYNNLKNKSSQMMRNVLKQCSQITLNLTILQFCNFHFIRYDWFCIITLGVNWGLRYFCELDSERLTSWLGDSILKLPGPGGGAPAGCAGGRSHPPRK